MDYHHVIEAAGVVSLGLIAYSYLVRWFETGSPAWQRWRPVAIGLTFGVVAVVLMISRIHVGDDRFVDARAIPTALVALVESVPAGVLAATASGSGAAAPSPACSASPPPPPLRWPCARGPDATAASGCVTPWC